MTICGGEVYFASSQAGPGNDINVGSPGAQKAPTWRELQIKAIARLLDLENQEHHRIADLSKHVGITLSSEHAALADALSEYVYWASRYPTPRNEAQFNNAYDIFRKVGFPAALGEPKTLARYESLWTMYRSAYSRARRVIDEP